MNPQRAVQQKLEKNSSDTLDFSDWGTSNPDLTANDIRAISQYLKSSTIVTRLNLQGAYIPESALVSWQELAKSIGSSRLEICNLDFNALGPDRVGVLMKELEGNTTLKVLTLKNIKMTNKGMEHVITMLLKNTSIKKLDLKQNGLTLAHFELLLDALKRNNRVCELYLAEKDCPSLSTGEYKTRLDHILKTNEDDARRREDQKQLLEKINTAKTPVKSPEKTSVELGSGSKPETGNKIRMADIRELYDSNKKLELEKNELLGTISELNDELEKSKEKISKLEKKLADTQTEQNKYNQLDSLYKKIYRDYEELKQAYTTQKDGETPNFQCINPDHIVYTSPRIDKYVEEWQKRDRNGNRKFSYTRDSHLLLGKGGFGEVLLVEWHKQLVAMKRLHDMAAGDANRKQFQKELSFMLSLRHPNIILCCGASTLPSNTFLLLELMDCDIAYLIKCKGENGVNVEIKWEADGKNYAQQIIAGICYLHSQNVVHKDLKSANCLVKDSMVKITDFGISRVSDPTAPVTKWRATTINTSSPELLTNQPYDCSTDIFSFGIILWEIFHEQMCWSKTEKSEHEVANMIISGKIEEAHPFSNNCPKELAKLIRKCWAKASKDRPKAAYVHDKLVEILSK